MQLEAKAILFDMDGTLVDSTVCVEAMWRAWGERHGIRLEAILAISHGRPTRETVRELAPHLDEWAEALAMDTEAAGWRDGIVALPGAMELVATLDPDAWGVVTSAPHPLAEARISFAGLPQPRVLVGSEDVRAGKPDPEGYLLGASRDTVPELTVATLFAPTVTPASPRMLRSSWSLAASQAWLSGFRFPL